MLTLRDFINRHPEIPESQLKVGVMAFFGTTERTIYYWMKNLPPVYVVRGLELVEYKATKEGVSLIDIFFSY